MNTPDLESVSPRRGPERSPTTPDFDDELPTSPWQSTTHWVEERFTIEDDEPPTSPSQSTSLHALRVATWVKKDVSALNKPPVSKGGVPSLPPGRRTLPPPLPAAAQNRSPTRTAESRPPPLPAAARARAATAATSTSSREPWFFDRPSRTFEMAIEPLRVSRLTPPAVERVDRNARTVVLPRAHLARSRRRWKTRFYLALFAIAGELWLAHRSGSTDLVEARALLSEATTELAALLTRAKASEPHRDAPSSREPSTPSVTPTPAVLPEVASSDGADPATTARIPPGMGLLKTDGERPGHRIFIGERPVGKTPESVLVPCGAATVKIGSAGQSRAIDVPCGEEIDVSSARLP